MVVIIYSLCLTIDSCCYKQSRSFICIAFLAKLTIRKHLTLVFVLSVYTWELKCRMSISLLPFVETMFIWICDETEFALNLSIYKRRKANLLTLNINSCCKVLEGQIQQFEMTMVLTHLNEYSLDRRGQLTFYYRSHMSLKSRPPVNFIPTILCICWHCFIRFAVLKHKRYKLIWNAFLYICYSYQTFSLYLSIVKWNISMNGSWIFVDTNKKGHINWNNCCAFCLLGICLSARSYNDGHLGMLQKQVWHNWI